MLRFNTSVKALEANQRAIQTTGHNIVNSATPGYTRQDTVFKTSAPLMIEGVGGIGQGIDNVTILRKTDSFLESRIESNNQVLGQLEQEENILSEIESAVSPVDGSLVEKIAEMVDELNELAMDPEDDGLRSGFVDEVENVASSFRELADYFEKVMDDIQDSIKVQVKKANEMISQIANFNKQIAVEPTNDALDQREQLLKELGNVTSLQVHYDDKNNAQVVIGGTLAVDRYNANLLQTVEVSQSELAIAYQGSARTLDIQGGALGGLLDMQNEVLPDYQNRIDTLAGTFAEELNSIHATGINNDGGFLSLQSEEKVDDPTAALSTQGFNMQSGDLTFTVRENATGNTTDFNISIDPATDSLQDVSNSIDAIANLSSSIDAEGHLSIDSAGGYSFSFSSDQSKILSEMEINSLFTGKTAATLDVSSHIKMDSDNLSFGKSYAPGNNENISQMIDAIQNKSHTRLGGITFNQHFSDTVLKAGQQLQAKSNDVTFQKQIHQDLVDRREAVSGVSVDEEIINLNKFQHGYQAAARLFGTINELMETAINMG